MQHASTLGYNVVYQMHSDLVSYALCQQAFDQAPDGQAERRWQHEQEKEQGTSKLRR